MGGSVVGCALRVAVGVIGGVAESLECPCGVFVQSGGHAGGGWLVKFLGHAAQAELGVTVGVEVLLGEGGPTWWGPPGLCGGGICYTMVRICHTMVWHMLTLRLVCRHMPHYVLSNFFGFSGI